MAEKVILVVPEAPATAPSSAVQPRTLHADRLRLGVLDNSKGNADHLLRFITDGIKDALPVASVVSRRKASVSLPAPADVLDKLSADADFVVTAMAD
jgi:hypothetical protein